MQSCNVIVRRLGTSFARPATRLTFQETSRVGEVPNRSGYKKVMDLQKLMCADDGLLVWQKRGARDSVPYYCSMLLMLGGIAGCFYNIYRLSLPKKA